MSSNRVQGKNIIIYLLYDGQYYPVFCAKSATLIQEQEDIEITSVNSGNDREFEPGMTVTKLDVAGVTTLNNSYSRISVLYLMQLSVRRTTQSLKIYLVDNNGAEIQITFDAIITSNSFTKDLGGAFSQSATSFKVTGPITITTPIDPPGAEVVKDPLYIDCVAGESSVHHDLLEQDNVTILHVDRSGTGHTETNGTPGNLEFKFTGGAGNGDISFDTTNPFNAGEVIYVLYKIQL